MPGIPSTLYLLYVLPNALSSNLGPQFNSAFRASLLAIWRSLFLLFFTLLIFLFILAILASIHLFLFGGCSLRGTPLTGSLGTLGSTNLSFFSDSLSFSAILSASFFMDLIFFLLNPALVLLDALVILSSKASILDFRLLISATRLTNFLASLKSLFHLCFCCVLVRGASNSAERRAKGPSGCLTSFSCSCSGSQVDIHRAGTACLCGGGSGGPPRGPCFTEVSIISGPDVHYSGEKLSTQLFSIENNLSIYALSIESIPLAITPVIDAAPNAVLIGISMNVANVATLDIPVAMLIPLEQAFNHVSRFNILVYFLYFFLNIFSLAINPHLLAWTTLR